MKNREKIIVTIVGDTQISVTEDEYIEDLKKEDTNMPSSYIIYPIIDDTLYKSMTQCLTLEQIKALYLNYHNLPAVSEMSFKVILQELFLKIVDDKDVMMPSVIAFRALDVYEVSDIVNNPDMTPALEECCLKDTNFFKVAYGAVGCTRVKDSKYDEHIFVIDHGTRVIETEKERMTIRFVNEYDKKRLGKVQTKPNGYEYVTYTMRVGEKLKIKEYISYVDKENSSNNYSTLLTGHFAALEPDCWSYGKKGYYPKVFGVRFMDEKNKR